MQTTTGEAILNDVLTESQERNFLQNVHSDAACRYATLRYGPFLTRLDLAQRWCGHLMAQYCTELLPFFLPLARGIWGCRSDHFSASSISRALLSGRQSGLVSITDIGGRCAMTSHRAS